jgi:hypothetical protein
MSTFPLISLVRLFTNTHRGVQETERDRDRGRWVEREIGRKEGRGATLRSDSFRRFLRLTDFHILELACRHYRNQHKDYK